MTSKSSKILSLAMATALGGTAAMAMGNERQVVGSMMEMDKEMEGLLEMLDKNADGSVSAEEVAAHQEMMNKFVMMAMDNLSR